MHDLGDIGSLLILLKFHIEHAWIMFILLYGKADGTKAMQQFFVDRTRPHYVDRRYIKKGLWSADSNFRVSKLLDRSHAEYV